MITVSEIPKGKSSRYSTMVQKNILEPTGVRTILIVLFFLNGSVVTAQLSPQYFYSSKGYGVPEGLSHGLVYRVHQEARGFLWMASYHGLNRFDGYEFTNYYANKGDSNSLQQNGINDITSSPDGDLWIVYRGADFVRYSVRQGKFIHYPRSVFTLPFEGNYLYSLTVGDDGKINYFYLNSINLYRFNPETQSFHVYPLPVNANSKDYLSAMVKDGGNSLLLTSRKGNIFRFDLLNNTFSFIGKYSAQTEFFVSRLTFGRYLWGMDTARIASCYDLQENREIVFPSQILPYFSEVADVYGSEKDGQHYIVTGGKLYVTGKNDFSSSPRALNPSLWDYRYLISVTEDSSANLWLGTMGMGVFTLHRRQNLFTTLRYQEKQLFVQSIRTIKSVDKSLFIGGYYGIDKYDLQTQKATPIIKNLNVYSVLPDPDNSQYLWYGQEIGRGYFYRRNLKTGINDTITLFTDEDLIHTVYDIEDDRRGNLWLAFDNQLVKLNRKTFQTEYFRRTTNDERTAPIRQIIIREDGEIVCATAGDGVYLFDPVTKKFSTTAERYGVSTSNLFVFSILFQNEVLWIGTNGTGVRTINTTLHSERSFTKKDGLPNNVVYSIVSDRMNNIWLSTNNGLSRYSSVTQTFRNFDRTDGLQDNEFNAGAYHTDARGFIYFGGIFGVSFFNPEILTEHNRQVGIALVGVNTFKGDFQSTVPIEELKELEFLSSEMPVRLEFAAFNFFQPEKNQYAYRIAEFGESWNYTGNNRNIVLGNLEGGTYTIEVKSSNNDGSIGGVLVLKVTIIPPVYRQLWFYILIGFLGIAIAVLIFYIRLKSERKQKVLLERLVAERTAETEAQKQEILARKEELLQLNAELTDANNTKDTFFSIIAHDLRSPVGAIIGYLSLLGDDYQEFTDEERKKFIGDCRSVSISTMDLLDNLLQWSRLQSGRISHSPSIIKVREIINRIEALFLPVCNQKNISFVKEIPTDAQLYADENIVYFIVRNIVSNAVKFTPSGGVIYISYQKRGDRICILISDTGAGMSEEAIDAIFIKKEYFSRPGTNKESGTGMGLRLCLTMAEISNGSISVQTRAEGGTEMVICLPAGAEGNIR